jgi:hypothetical protein
VVPPDLPALRTASALRDTDPGAALAALAGCEDGRCQQARDEIALAALDRLGRAPLRGSAPATELLAVLGGQALARQPCVLWRVIDRLGDLRPAPRSALRRALLGAIARLPGEDTGSTPSVWMPGWERSGAKAAFGPACEDALKTMEAIEEEERAQHRRRKRMYGRFEGLGGPSPRPPFVRGLLVERLAMKTARLARDDARALPLRGAGDVEAFVAWFERAGAGEECAALELIERAWDLRGNRRARVLPALDGRVYRLGLRAGEETLPGIPKQPLPAAVAGATERLVGVPESCEEIFYAVRLLAYEHPDRGWQRGEPLAHQAIAFLLRRRFQLLAAWRS